MSEVFTEHSKATIGYLRKWDDEAKVWVAYIPLLKRFTQSKDPRTLRLAVDSLCSMLEGLSGNEWPTVPSITT